MSSFDPHSFHNEVRQMQYQFQDHLSNPNDPLARQLRSNLQRLEDDLQSGRHTNPYTVREELKKMREQVKQAGHEHVFGYSTENSMHHWLDHHIDNLR